MTYFTFNSIDHQTAKAILFSVNHNGKVKQVWIPKSLVQVEYNRVYLTQSNLNKFLNR